MNIFNNDNQIDIEDREEQQEQKDFSDLFENSRNGFIRKVYTILTMQICASFIMILPGIYFISYAQFLQTNEAFLFLAVIAIFIIEICIFCNPETARKYPTNFYYLGAFTICMGYFLSCVCSQIAIVPTYDGEWQVDLEGRDIVLAASQMTGLITGGLTLYAWKTKKDFTTMGCALFLGALTLCIVGLFSFLFRSISLYIIYLGFGIFIYGLYIIYDTQLILGNKTYKLGIDDYIIGSMILYIDIVMLFLKLLKFLQAMRARNSR